MVTTNFGGKIILAGTLSKKEVEDHVQAFDKGLTIVTYMLNSAKAAAAGNTEVIKALEMAEGVIHSLQTAEEERYKKFYGI